MRCTFIATHKSHHRPRSYSCSCPLARSRGTNTHGTRCTDHRHVSHQTTPILCLVGHFFSSDHGRVSTRRASGRMHDHVAPAEQRRIWMLSAAHWQAMSTCSCDSSRQSVLLLVHPMLFARIPPRQGIASDMIDMNTTRYILAEFL